MTPAWHLAMISDSLLPKVPFLTIRDNPTGCLTIFEPIRLLKSPPYNVTTISPLLLSCFHVIVTGLVALRSGMGPHDSPREDTCRPSCNQAFSALSPLPTYPLTFLWQPPYEHAAICHEKKWETRGPPPCL